MTDAYQQQLGDRLRAIRHQQGLTLHEVEAVSGGEWKAVVVGSYERGDRAISMPKLARLAAFYGVPVADLLPGARERDDGADRRRCVLDLTRLDERQGPEPLRTVARFARRIQVDRGDYNGRVLTMREADVHAVAVATGQSPDGLFALLEEQGALQHG